MQSVKKVTKLLLDISRFCLLVIYSLNTCPVQHGIWPMGWLNFIKKISSFFRLFLLVCYRRKYGIAVFVVVPA